MLKKLLSFTLAMIMIFSCMSVVAFADSNIITDKEPNDELETAQPITPNCSVEGKIAASDLTAAEPTIDIDVYSFKLKERSKVTLEFEGNSITMMPIISDESGDNSLLPDIYDDLENLESMPEDYTVTGYLPKGIYYVMISDVLATEESKYNFEIKTESAVESLKYEKGVWKYYVGKKRAKETRLVKYKGTWFFIKNGVWSKKTTGLVNYEYQWFYIEKGKWTKKTNTLIKHNGKWFYLTSGKWDEFAETLVKFKGKWFYVKNGKWNKSTTIVEYKNRKFYVEKGQAKLGFSGKKKIGGQTYIIKKGKVV